MVALGFVHEDALHLVVLGRGWGAYLNSLSPSSEEPHEVLRLVTLVFGAHGEKAAAAQVTTERSRPPRLPQAISVFVCYRLLQPKP